MTYQDEYEKALAEYSEHQAAWSVTSENDTPVADCEFTSDSGA